MSLGDWIGNGREASAWRLLRAEYDRLEGLGHPGPGERVAGGQSWRAVPRMKRNARERVAMRRVPRGMRVLVDTVIDGYARHSNVPAYIEIGGRPVVGFIDLVGSSFGGSNFGGSNFREGNAYMTLRIDPALAEAPDGFARVLAVHAALATPYYTAGAVGEVESAQPSRSAMAGLRRLWATTGDYPAPDGWTYVGKTLLRNAYWRAGIDHRTLRLGGEFISDEMAQWADAQPHPYDARYYPSWRSRHLAQLHDAEIFTR
jgi:hypothetical protein